jgi:hypothetical protein
MSRRADMATTEGTVDFDLPAAGKPCKTWYKIVGDLDCGITPLIAVHGGPGLTHHYMLPMVDFQEKFGIPVIFYDREWISLVSFELLY